MTNKHLTPTYVIKNPPVFWDNCSLEDFTPEQGKEITALIEALQREIDASPFKGILVVRVLGFNIHPERENSYNHGEVHVISSCHYLGGYECISWRYINTRKRHKTIYKKIWKMARFFRFAKPLSKEIS